MTICAFVEEKEQEAKNDARYGFTEGISFTVVSLESSCGLGCWYINEIQYIIESKPKKEPAQFACAPPALYYTSYCET
eukprot:scaffold3710_cov286-Chaetoceros_neogracile.AAC.23